MQVVASKWQALTGRLGGWETAAGPMCSRHVHTAAHSQPWPAVLPPQDVQAVQEAQTNVERSLGRSLPTGFVRIARMGPA